MADIAAEGRALAERIGIAPLRRSFARVGTKFLYALDEDESWCVHPSGYGIIVVRPDRAPLWVRIANGEVLQTVIEPWTGAPGEVNFLG